MKKPSNRDLSQLSALLAEHIRASADKENTAPRIENFKAMHANDNKPARERLAWPAFERLAYRRDYARLYALRHWRNMCFPGMEVEAHEGEDYDPEVTVEMRPSEGELLTAAGWEIVGRERWQVTGEMANVYQSERSETIYKTNKNGGIDATLGALMFRDGKLTQWGTTRKGSPLRPVERPRGVKGGGSDPIRSDGVIWSYRRRPEAFVRVPISSPAWTQSLSASRRARPCLASIFKTAG